MKKPWKSKTLYINIVAIIAMFLESQLGYELDAETQVVILAVINLVLRLITQEPISWK